MRPEAGQVRHLLYHLYPVGESWRWNVEQLRRRMSLFNGRRLMAVAVGPETATRDDVEGATAGMGLELRYVANDGVLREMATFPLLISQMAPYQSASDVHLYAHAKGATSERWAPGARRWTTAMLTTLLDYWPAVERMLRDFPVVGCLRRDRQSLPDIPALWHYSGSWRWTRNRDLFARDWRRIDNNWCGTEGYPGKHFTREEAGCLWGAFGGGGLGLYLEEYWTDWASAAFQGFQEDHVADRLSPLLCTVILTAHAQPDRVHEAIASVQAQTSPDWQLLIVDSGRIADTGAYERYAGDARITVERTGETAELRAKIGIQAWAINEAWARGLVRGDLVMHLCDDDCLFPDAVATYLAAARAHPAQEAWYRAVERQQLDATGGVQPMGQLATCGVLGPGNSGDCRIDGMQICHRREARTPWPLQRQLAWHADGQWIDALAANHAVHPLPGVMGVHRHTPDSTFTKRVP